MKMQQVFLLIFIGAEIEIHVLISMKDEMKMKAAQVGTVSMLSIFYLWTTH